ncbi:MAG: hypothetical protein RTV31_17035 [Candidatus Thorarchaeota archaeon]
MKVRIPKALSLLGLVLILISMIPGYNFDGSGELYPGEYTLHPFQCVDAPYIDFDVDRLLSPVPYNHTDASLYILSLGDCQKFVEGSSLETLIVYFQAINVSECYTVPDLPTPGYYVILVTTTDARGIGYTLHVYRPIPHLSIIISGVLVLSLGLVLHYHTFYTKRRFKKNWQ